MRIIQLILGSLLIVSGATSAQDWAEYVDAEEHFAINFPGTPEVREFGYASEYGVTLPAKAYTLKNDEASYSLTVVNYNAGQKIYEELPDRTDEGNNSALWLYDQRASMSFAAHNIRKRGGEITFDAWNHIDMVEGHQLQITNADNSRTYAGMYLHQGRLYIIEAIVPAGGLPQGLFQQSLSFLDDDLRRIRYQLTVDGSKRRVPRPEGEENDTNY